MTELIEQLAAELAARIRPAIPLSVDLWDAETIATYLKVSKKQVLERYAPLPDFPRAIRLPAATGKGHPRWKASDVIDWAEKYQDRKRAA